MTHWIQLYIYYDTFIYIYIYISDVDYEESIGNPVPEEEEEESPEQGPKPPPSVLDHDDMDTDMLSENNKITLHLVSTPSVARQSKSGNIHVYLCFQNCDTSHI